MSSQMYNTNIEKAILSSILFNYELIEDISSILKPSDFYMSHHALVYEAMINLYDKDLPIDEDFIRRAISTKDLDDSVLIEILSANAITNAKAYALEIKELSSKRELLKISNDIQKIILEDENNSHDALEKTQDMINNVSNNLVANGLKSTMDIVNGFDQWFIDQATTKESSLIKTGIKRFDNLIGSFELGKLIVVGARPSMGKTAFATTITKHILSSGYGVLFDSLEMDSNDLMRRLIANYTEDNINDFKKGVCANINKYKSALEFYKSKDLILHDTSNPTVRQLKAKASKIFRQNKNIKVWIIDHLRYIKTPTKDRHLEVGNITKELKEVAKKYNVCLVLLTQLNREVQQKTRNDHRPNLSDLRDSGAIEEDADMVIFPHRPSYYTRTDPAMPEKAINEAELIVAKNRDGLTGVAKCMFNGPSTKFFDNGFNVTATYYNEDVNNIDIPDI